MIAIYVEKTVHMVYEWVIYGYSTQIFRYTVDMCNLPIFGQKKRDLKKILDMVKVW